MTELSGTVDGIPMRWDDRGEGTPVVFLHGIPTSPRLWRHVLPRIDGARCLAWEMPGYGASIRAGDGRDISVRRQAEYLNSWLDDLQIDRALIVGHDLGGGVAQILAAQHPEKIHTLVLINSICYDSWPIPSVQLMQRTAPVLGRMPDAVLYPMLYSLVFRGHDDKAMARESIGVHWPHYSEHGAMRALLRQVSALDTRDTLAVAERLPQLRVPAAVIWGAADQFQKVAYGRRLAADLDAELHQVDGGKHFVPEDHPDQVAAVVNEFVRTSH